MENFVTLLISGITSGSIYCLIAVGFVVVFKATKILNFSQGMLVVIGAYLMWTVFSIGIPVYLAIILGFIMTIIVSMALERVCMRPLVGQPILASVMVTLCLIGGLRGLVLLLWGPQGKKFPVEIVSSGVWTIGGMGISKEKAMALIASLCLIILLYLFFKFTRIGLGMKVTSEDHFIGQIVGLKINRIFSYSWGIAGLVAAVGGLFLGLIISIRPELEEIGLKALSAMLLGGLESIPGAIIGGIMIGLAEALSGWYLASYLGNGIGEVSPYILMIIVLLIRPYGLFGWKKIERV